MPDDTAKQAATGLATRPDKAVVHDAGLFYNLMDTARFEHLQRVSNVFANSSLVPEHFRGKAADCFIAVEMAMRLKLHPFNLMQSLYVVHGKPGIEAKMAIALINSSGIFEGPLQWQITGEGMKRQAIARAVHAKTKQLCEATCTMEMAKAEGWLDKSGSKWKTLPDLMLQYRSASFFSRLYCPEVIFGMSTTDELHDAFDGAKDVTPQPTGTPQRPSLRDRLNAMPATVFVDSGGDFQNAPAQPSPEPAAATQTAPEVSEPQPESMRAPEPARKAPTVPFEDVVKYAKRAKTQDQSDVVLDTLNDPAYSDDERREVKEILASKSYA